MPAEGLEAVKVFCAICNKFMGDISIEGKLRKGYAALSVYIECEDCHEPEDCHKSIRSEDDAAVKTLMGMFGMKK